LKQGRKIILELIINGEKFSVTATTLSICEGVLQQGLKPLIFEVLK
jgi:hypothetical protein